MRDAPLERGDEGGGAGGDALDEVAAPPLAALDEDVGRLGDHRRREVLPGLLREPGGGQVGERVLAHDLEHPVAGARRGRLGEDQRPVDQRAHQLHGAEVVVDDRAGGGVHEPEVEGAGEDPEPPEDLALVVVEQLDRQRDRRVDARRPLGPGPRRRAEGVGALGHEGEELGGRQRASPRGGQLDGQRQAVDRLAELRDRLHRALGSVPPGVAAGDQLEEEGDRGRGRRVGVGGRREAERVEHHALARPPRRAAGGSW